MRLGDVSRQILAVAAATALLLPLPAQADSVALPRPMLIAPSASGALIDTICRGAECPAARARRLQFGAAPGLGAALVEFPTYTLPGQPRRSHHGLGLRSTRMESALNAVGIEARHCLAPVVRMHSRLSSSFELSGTLWVYLRCTLD